jgi:subtilisin family serine protease
VTHGSRLLSLLAVFGITLASCGGGGGGGGTAPPGPTPTPTPVPGATQTVALTTGSTAAVNLAYGGLTATLSLPITSAPVGTQAQITLTTIPPAGIGLPSAHQRRPKYVEGTSAYIVLSISGGTATGSQTPSLTLTGLPASGAYTLGEISSQGYDALTTGTATAGSVVFSPQAATVSFQPGQYVLTISPGSAAAPTPTPAPQAAFTCPSSDSVDAVARGANATGGADAVRRLARRSHSFAANAGLIAVTYDRSTARSAAASIAARESALGATVVRSLDFAHIGEQIHVLSVAPATVASVEATLRTQPGVRSVANAGARRSTQTVSQRDLSNDPYFAGFGPGAPYFESYNVVTQTSIPGQWDMHAIGLDYAFEYSQAPNGSAVSSIRAVGASGVHIAIIDTGEDSTHPELSSKIVYQKCFISGANAPYTQSTSDFETDPQGHGTDVSGIAAADLGNALGFVGAGGNSTIYAYRVFPEPDDTCESDNEDDQCGASTTDIASAIDDAVAQHVNVISMSVGGYITGEEQGCSAPGVDGDPTEGAAVAEAIAANIVVVAAAGNDYNGALVAPACDAGVIAVGATSLDDGQLNGTGHTGGTAASPVEYVASYSDYGSPAANLHNASAWGIVAPGGDASSGYDTDDLHWIENLWTSTPFVASPGDLTFAGQCTADYPNTTNVTPPVDCRQLIAGTSMATPHVAGAVALILAVSSAYSTPAEMKQLLCQTADNINDAHQGCGRLNIYRAMAVALGDPNPP